MKTRYLFSTRFLLAVALGAGLLGTVTARAAILQWDANGTNALVTDGGGSWTNANVWTNLTTGGNQTWVSGSDVVFGNNGAGGAVTLGSATTVNSFTFNPFTGTYTLGTAGNTITLNNSITMKSGAGAVSIVSPIALGAAQTWSNVSANTLTVSGTVTNQGYLLTIDGTGSNTISGIISGTGGLTKIGTGVLTLGGANTFSGGLTIKLGTVIGSTSANAFGGTGTGQITLGDSAGGSANATLVSGTTGLTFANPIVLAANTTGILTIGSGSGLAATTYSGGVTGTNNLTINSAGTALTFSINPINNVGAVTILGAGTTAISGGIGTNVTGIAVNSGAGGVTISGPVTLGAAQTWSNASASTFTVTGAVTNQGYTLTFDGNGNFSFGTATTGIISGNGGIIKNGSGLLILGSGQAPTHTYTGTTTINGGTVMLASAKKSTGNFTLNGGLLTDYFQSTTAFTSGLGAGNNQIQIYGDSGFGGGNGNSTWRIGTSLSLLQWGSTYFNPTTLKFLAPGVDNMGPSIYGQVTLDNGLDLNGSSRTVSVAAATGTAAIYTSYGKINGNITNTSGTAASLVKIGGGNLLLVGTDSYNGGTVINQGALRFASIVSMPATGNVQVNDGAILGINLGGAGGWSNGTNGVGTLGGLLAGLGGRGTSTVGYTGNVGLMLDVQANTNYIGNIANVGTTLAVYKIGASALTLSGNNTYSGGTFLLQGTIIGDSATAMSTAGNITFNGGTLQFTANSTTTDWGSAIKNSALAIQLNTGGQTVTLAGGMDSSNVGGLTKVGTGTLVLTGTNTYSEATTVSVGTLTVNGGMISNSALNVAAGNTTMIITNGGKVFSGGATSQIGNNNNNNLVLVVGGGATPSIWDLGGQFLNLGGNSYLATPSNNVLRVDGAGVYGSAIVTNVNGAFSTGGGGNWSAAYSSIVLTNGGQFFNKGSTAIGNPYYAVGNYDSIIIVGGVANSMYYGSSNAFVVGDGIRPGAHDNQVYVGAGGVLTNVGYYSTDRNADFAIGYGYNSTAGTALYNNRLVVDGGKVFTLGNLTVGYSASGTAFGVLSNSMLIANSGLVNVPGALNVGFANGANTTSSYNRVSVTSGGVLTSPSVTIGLGAGITSNNYLLVDGGSVFAKTVTVTRASNYITFNSGTLNVASSIVYSNGTAFVVGDGTGAATLILPNTGTHRFQAGLTIANNGTLLTGGGTTIPGTVTVQGGGTLVPGNGATLFTVGTLTLQANSHLKIEIGGDTLGSWDQLFVTGTATLSGSILDVSLINGFVPAEGDGYLIMDISGSTIGTFAGLTNGAAFAADGTTFQINYFGGDGNDVVLTVIPSIVIPEPGSLVLVTLGLGCCWMVWFKRRRA